jgi:hypothetical protein
LREEVGFQRGRAGRSIQVSHQFVPLFSDGLICFDYGCGRHEAFVVGIVAAGTYVADETAIGRRRIGGRAAATAAAGRVAGRPNGSSKRRYLSAFISPPFGSLFRARADLPRNSRKDNIPARAVPSRKKRLETDLSQKHIKYPAPIGTGLSGQMQAV